MSKIKIKNEHLIAEFLGSIIAALTSGRADKVAKALGKSPSAKKIANDIKRDREKNKKMLQKTFKDDPELAKRVKARMKKLGLKTIS